MALNMFAMKRTAALVIMGMLPVLTFFIINTYYGFIWALVGMGAALVLGILLSSLMLSNPFTKMLEGGGILAFNIDSTGILNPFIVKVNTPYISGNFRGKEVKDVWNRKSVFYLANPFINKTPANIDEKGGLTLTLDNEGLNKSRFALYHYPVLLYNSQIGSFITKDVLSEKENTLFAEHTILFLNRQVEELSSQIRNFARYIVEQLKPNMSMMGGMWIWIIIGAVIILLLVLFGPSIMETLQGGAGEAVVNTVSSVKNGMTITPMG